MLYIIMDSRLRLPVRVRTQSGVNDRTGNEIAASLRSQ